jgi:cytochrome c
MRIVRWPWERAMGETAIECPSHSKGRKPDMKRKYVCLVAAAAWAGSAAGALAGDAAAGETIFTQKCKVCHQIGEGAKNFVGPELNGLIGRKNGSAPGYNYSDADKNSGITWDEATLKEYLLSPKAKIPGTKMIFAGLPKEDDRDNLVTYLAQFGTGGKKK